MLKGMQIRVRATHILPFNVEYATALSGFSNNSAKIVDIFSFIFFPDPGKMNKKQGGIHAVYYTA